MADSDLTQYDGAPAWVNTADVGSATDPLLIPTDFKKITGTDNGLNKAPVNRSIKRLKDLIIGLRGAIMGDFSPALLRTLTSLQVDYPSGNLSTANTGDIETLIGNVRAAISTYCGVSLLAQVDAIIGGFGMGTLARLKEYKLGFEGTGTGGTGANPPLATSVKNELRAKNIPKGWSYVSIQAGVVNATGGFGNWSAATTTALAGKIIGDRLRITLADAMDNIFYAPVVQIRRGDGQNAILPQVLNDTITTTQFDIGFWNTGKAPMAVPPYGDWNTWAFDGTFEVLFHLHGQQTT